MSENNPDQTFKAHNTETKEQSRRTPQDQDRHDCHHDAQNSNTQKPFGFRDVDAKEKPSLVQSVFSRVAGSYDLMNDVMSFGIHRYWKQELIKLLRPFPGMSLIDMAGGTGDIAFRFLDESASFTPQPSVTICDHNPDMLKEGRRKAINQGRLTNIEWVECDAAKLPFEDNQFDAYTISFGLRNVTEMEKALQEAFRVLKPGGMFFCLEFSKVNHEGLKKLYEFYSFSVIPKLGSLIAKDKQAYEYLVESIARFPDQDSLSMMITKAAFHNVTWRNLTDGIVAIHSAQKPN